MAILAKRVRMRGCVQFEVGQEQVIAELNNEGIWCCKYSTIASLLNTLYGEESRRLNDPAALQALLARVARTLHGQVIPPGQS